MRLATTCNNFKVGDSVTFVDCPSNRVFCHDLIGRSGKIVWYDRVIVVQFKDNSNYELNCITTNCSCNHLDDRLVHKGLSGVRWVKLCAKVDAIRMEV